jgi:hypothetical protein
MCNFDSAATSDLSCTPGTERYSCVHTAVLLVNLVPVRPHLGVIRVMLAPLLGVDLLNLVHGLHGSTKFKLVHPGYSLYCIHVAILNLVLVDLDAKFSSVRIFSKYGCRTTRDHAWRPRFFGF